MNTIMVLHAAAALAVATSPVVINDKKYNNFL